MFLLQLDYWARATHTRLVGACEDVFYTAGKHFPNHEKDQYVIICHRCKDVKGSSLNSQLTVHAKYMTRTTQPKVPGKAPTRVAEGQLRTNQTSVLVLPMRDGVKSVMEATDFY